MKGSFMSIDRKVSVITGASQGIGAALVAAYRTRGYSVVASSLSIAPSTDPDVLTIPGDISQAGTGRDIITAAISKFGRVDTLINDAGLFISKPFTEYTPEDYATMVGVNLTGFFYIAQAAISDMERRRSGHIVQITTSLVAHASSAVPSALASLTKGGLDAATRSLAIEYARRGIRVNAVSPGVITTPMHAPETFEALGRLHPIGHMGEISDVVDAIMYLEQAPFVTGETVHVDGGQSAGH
jgi:NAD(P)-dependent dehydrogenase (short-subunit alcohol dehydrogenase family)